MNTIELLKQSHSNKIKEGLINKEKEMFYWINGQNEHAKTSIEFTISVLESFKCVGDIWIELEDVEDKIKELKQYLNGGR